jgi:TolA-binding protein
VHRTAGERDALQEEVTQLRAKCENLSSLLQDTADGAAHLQLTQQLSQLQQNVDRLSKENAEQQQALVAKTRACEELAEELTRARAVACTFQHDLSQREAFERLLARLLELNRENCAVWNRITASATRAPHGPASLSSSPSKTSNTHTENTEEAKSGENHAEASKNTTSAESTNNNNNNSYSKSTLSHSNSALYRTHELLVHKLVGFVFEGSGGSGQLQFHYARHGLELASFRAHFALVTNVFQHVLPDRDYFDLHEILGQYALLHPTHGLPILGQWHVALEACHAALVDCERAILEHIDTQNTGMLMNSFLFVNCRCFFLSLFLSLFFSLRFFLLSLFFVCLIVCLIV